MVGDRTKHSKSLGMLRHITGILGHPQLKQLLQRSYCSLRIRHYISLGLLGTERRNRKSYGPALAPE